MARNTRQLRPRGPALPKEVLSSTIDYKDFELMAKFLGPGGTIVSRKRTNFPAQRQRDLKKAIKRARHMGFIPFVG